jgi:hypothetical protein
MWHVEVPIIYVYSAGPVKRSVSHLVIVVLLVTPGAFMQRLHSRNLPPGFLQQLSICVQRICERLQPLPMKMSGWRRRGGMLWLSIYTRFPLTIIHISQRIFESLRPHLPIHKKMDPS